MQVFVHMLCLVIPSVQDHGFCATGPSSSLKLAFLLLADVQAGNQEDCA